MNKKYPIERPWSAYKYATVEETDTDTSSRDTTPSAPHPSSKIPHPDWAMIHAPLCMLVCTGRHLSVAPVITPVVTPVVPAPWAAPMVPFAVPASASVRARHHPISVMSALLPVLPRCAPTYYCTTLVGVHARCWGVHRPRSLTMRVLKPASLTPLLLCPLLCPSLTLLTAAGGADVWAGDVGVGAFAVGAVPLGPPRRRCVAHVVHVHASKCLPPALL